MSRKKMACNIKNDPKAFYRYERKKMRNMDPVGPLIDDNGDAMHDSRCVASMLKSILRLFFSRSYN